MPSGMTTEQFDTGKGTPLAAAIPLPEIQPADSAGARATAMVFRTLGHPLRLQVIGYLHRHGPTSRAQLTSALNERWSMMEHHLRTLVKDGFLIPDGQGIQCVYRLTDGLLRQLQSLCAPSGEMSTFL